MLDLFIRFLKIGLVGFGGGWAIIPIIYSEIVEDAKYIDENEFYDLVAIAGSTPGPVAVNAATYVGYKIAGILGASIATLGVVLPPFTIISLIAYGLSQYIGNRLIQAVLKGLRAAVIGLIVVVLYSTAKTTFTQFNNIQMIAGASITIIVVVLVAVFRIHPIIAVLIAALLGLLIGVARIW